MKVRQEAVLTVTNDQGEFIAAVKNGEGVDPIFYKVEKMGTGDVKEFLEEITRKTL